jgi:dolichol-phosphate mannosyltransferase
VFQVLDGKSVIAITPVLNEELKIGSVVSRMPRDLIDEVLVVDDGSTDRSRNVAEDLGATVLPMAQTEGVGAALRLGFEYSLARNYDVIAVVAGNNKDAPEELRSIVAPIVEGRADIVQGSRYLNQTRYLGSMPAYRRIATRLHPVLFNLLAGSKMTDTTNGFRAIRSDILRDPNLDLSAHWLDQYELEVYLLYKAIRLGYIVEEAPVTKIYPPKAVGQTKMKPITGWWSILRPLALLALRIKR